MKRNSSTRRQQVANPRPLFVGKKTYLSVVVAGLGQGDDLPVGAGYQDGEWLLVRNCIEGIGEGVHVCM